VSGARSYSRPEGFEALVILAVDGGIANCGWSVVAPKGRVLDLDVFLSSPTEGVEKSTDRARRIRDLSKALLEVIRAYGCTAIAAEQMLFHGKLNAVVSQLLPWGALLGIAEVLDLELYEVPAKTWQPAMLGRKVSYEQLEKKLARFVKGQAEAKLLSITPSKRTHALDSVGVGLYATLAKPTAIRRSSVRL
jgi:Holliday junction resolvasome RuvABC endonuclease subunit